MNRQRVLEQWNSFSREVLPPGCGEVQITETRRAFYGGAVAVYRLLLQNMTGEEEAGLKFMDDLKAEFDHYAERLRAGVG